MRINEIASAEEQIELWKLISNSVWQSLQQQQRVEQQRKAVADLKPKPTSKAKRSFHPLPPTPTQNMPKKPKSSAKSVSDKPPNTSRLSSVPISFQSGPTSRPSAQARSNGTQQINTKSTPSNQNQEFPSPAMTPVKLGPSSRKA